MMMCSRMIITVEYDTIPLNYDDVEDVVHPSSFCGYMHFTTTRCIPLNVGPIDTATDCIRSINQVLMQRPDGACISS
jgi:hypothetical protein